ncbi:uncharacterized protein LOC100706980 isoform X4 [Oreochromis niloticus]|uniref:uncharacterized protein LOC100706980 isoform X4 n=1 Tax=Oreochromis niloticus TaxID=8128 RepID=UPI0009058C1B|nr:uncharacterized protein LOC100706980 isoform X4 [Oreochromis niloticus]
MGSSFTIHNKTPYALHYSSVGRGGVRTVHGHSKGKYLHPIPPFNSEGLRFRYGDHSEWDLRCAGHSAPYTLRESDDGEKIELVNGRLNVIADCCANFGRIDDQKQEHERCQQQKKRRKIEDETRQQAALHRKRTIQEQIEKENKKLRELLSEAHDRLQLELNLKAQKHYHQQHSQVLHELVAEEHGIERDEVTDVNDKFKELLSKYDIREDQNVKIPLKNRMKTLQNELTLQYFKEHHIPTSLQWALDQATGYVNLSLTERFNILKSVVKMTLDGDSDIKCFLMTGQDKKTEFLFKLQEQLQAENPTLARQVLANVLDLSSKLPQSCKEILCHIVFNSIWTPKEIRLFIRQTSRVDQETVAKILHKACTYRLSCDDALSALKKKNPVDYIQHCVDRAELDKDADTLLAELEDKNYPECILSLLRKVLTYIEEELPKYVSKPIKAKKIEDCKKIINSLDFNNHKIDALKKVLIVVSRAVKECTTFTTKSSEQVQGYFPRLSQLASLLLLLLPQTGDKKGSLLEIGTGEGKTCILAMFATIQATRGIKVDIVTNSSLLASRDQDEWRKLYDMFGITSSTVPPTHIDNCSFKDHDKLLEDAYSQQVVYGTVGTFAADILRQEFEKKTTRGLRGFECVVADEVDYMTLDCGVQVTYLSDQARSLRHVKQVLASIWAMMSACWPVEMFETGEIRWGTRIQHFHKVLMQAVVGSESEDFSVADLLMLGGQMGFYSQEDVDELNKAEGQTQTETDSFKDAKWTATENIMANIGLEEQCKLLRQLETKIENNVSVDCYSLMDNKAKLYRKDSSHRYPDVSLLLLENGCACEIMSEESLIQGAVDKLKSTIKYSDECSVKSLDECKGFIIVPSFLKTYIENRLPLFAENALKAIRMTPGREYMIEKAPEADTGSFNDADSHQYDAIIPVDFEASGMLEKNKRWGEGLQQFLEMKHQLAISQLSNVTNYMSNFHFFKRYLSGKGIFGVSGTLGDEAEKVFLERHYKTASYVIPAHRHKKLVELPAVQVSGGSTQWIQVICETVQRAADRGQVVLIICEDVNTADELKTKMDLPERQANDITMYTISEKHKIEKQNFSHGNIIIATNLGGRGTDINVQQNVNECGGLFVLLTYFPRSHRVEQQVFGRTARKGNPGMVQMVLNQGHLAPAYQGHSIETMRLLREEYELRHLDSMEKYKCDIEIKEALFSTFCEFLCDFDKNYTVEERSDLSKLKLKDVPEYFKIHQNKFDYQTALNALKESWALWLILHEEHISRHDDISKLREDLTKDLKKTGDFLLQGTSCNFYDYIKQATSRTDLHCMNKTKCDFGAKTYWQKAAECDHFYSAVALYNQAYITLNLRKEDYIAEAKKLLEEAQSAVEVYLSESTNTMMFCNFSVMSAFVPHHTNSNLQIQMQASMNIFKSWKGYIESALTTLRQLDDSEGDAEVEDSSVYHLSKDKDLITTNELMMLCENGLSIVFEVKKKPEFCYDALACFVLGALQVAAGVLVCALSCGGASQFGLGLTCEGVSDMIEGIKGMIQGGFDWAEWAISKATTIGLSLISGGFSRLKKARSAVRSGTKSLITGAKSTSVCTVKQCFLKVGKYAVQELGKQGCISDLTHTVEKETDPFFQKVLKDVFEKKVFSLIKANRELDEVLTNFICSGIPKTALENGSSEFIIDRGCEEQMLQSVDLITREVIPALMMNCTMVLKVLNILSELCGAVTQHTGGLKGLDLMEKSAENVQVNVQTLDSIPTEKVINNTFVPQLLQSMEKLSQGRNDQDGRHGLSDVKRFKHELINMIAESASSSYVEACFRHMTSIMSKMCMSQINHVAGGAVRNILSSVDAQSFCENQLYKHHMKKAIQSPHDLLSQSEKRDLECYIEKISDVNHPATALDIHVLTQSDALEGKGIKLVMVDNDGKKLSEDYFPGKEDSAGDIVLQLKKEPKNPTQTEGSFSEMTEGIWGEQSQCSGHFEILSPDGTLIPVNSEGQNCLYHAVVQATWKNQGDMGNEAVILRNEIKHTLQQNLPRYVEVLKLQKEFEETCTSPGRYYICGGHNRSRKNNGESWKKSWDDELIDKKWVNKDDIVKNYHLGMVGKYYTLKDKMKGIKIEGKGDVTVEADHIPPKCVFIHLNNNFEKVDKWLNDHKDNDLTDLVDNTIKKIINDENEEVNNNEMCKNVIDKLRIEYTTEQNKSKDSKTERKKKIAIELYMKKNRHEMMILEKMRKDIILKANPNKTEQIYDLICKHGNNGVCRNVLQSHHQQGLTYGNSNYSKAVSKILQDALLAGDEVKVIKWSLMVANPEVAAYIRQKIDSDNPSQNHKTCNTPAKTEQERQQGGEGTGNDNKTCNTPAKTEQERQQGGEGTGNDNKTCNTPAKTEQERQQGEKEQVMTTKHVTLLPKQNRNANKGEKEQKHVTLLPKQNRNANKGEKEQVMTTEKNRDQ